MIILAILAACGPPDLHAELDCPGCEDQLREHFGVDVSNEVAEEKLLLGLEILATWQLHDTPWADDAPGETPTARAYNLIALWVEKTTWDGGRFIVHPEDHELLLGTLAGDRAVHEANLTLNLINDWAGSDAAGQAAEEASETCEDFDDEELCFVLTACAMWC